MGDNNIYRLLLEFSSSSNWSKTFFIIKSGFNIFDKGIQRGKTNVSYEREPITMGYTLSP